MAGNAKDPERLPKPTEDPAEPARPTEKEAETPQQPERQVKKSSEKDLRTLLRRAMDGR